MHEVAASLPAHPLQRIPGVAIVLGLLVVVFGAIAPGFLSPANISNVLVQSTILMMLALPMTSLFVAIVSLATGSMLIGVTAAVVAGLAFGTLNGWLVSVVGIPPFVATLGTLGMAQGLSLIVSDGQSVVGIPHSVRDIYSATLLGIPVPIVMAIVTYLVFYGLLYHTRF